MVEEDDERKSSTCSWKSILLKNEGLKGCQLSKPESCVLNMETKIGKKY